MEKEDSLDGLISKFFKKIKKEVIPPKTSCPEEEVLWKRVRGELNAKETEGLEKHLLSCPECLDTLESLRLIKDTEQSLLDVPDSLFRKTKKAIRRELKQSSKSTSPAPHKILLVWDRLHERITQVPSKFVDILSGPMPELQTVRENREYKKGLKGFPLRIHIKGDTGEIFLDVDRSGKKGFLTLKARFQFTPPQPTTHIRAVLYKADRSIAGEDLDDRGEVFFHAIKEGTYNLELFKEETCIEKIQLPIVSVQDEY